MYKAFKNEGTFWSGNYFNSTSVDFVFIFDFLLASVLQVVDLVYACRVD